MESSCTIRDGISEERYTMTKQQCIVVTTSATEEDAVRQLFSPLEIVRGDHSPVESRIQRTTYFRAMLGGYEKAFLNSKRITYFGDEKSTVGVV